MKRASVILAAGCLMSAVVSALVTAGLTEAAASPARPAVVTRMSVPPECQQARVIDNSGAGPTMWVLWCGTGAAGEPPMDATTFTVVDGGVLSPKACPKVNPCVVVWPGSPPS